MSNGVLLFLFFSVFHVEPGMKAGRDLKEAIQSKENPKKVLISLGFGALLYKNSRECTCLFFY